MPATWPTIDNTFAIDPSIWAVVLENLLSDDDSYVNKGCDCIVYRMAANDVYSWRLSRLGEAFGSLALAGNDLGTPGSFTAILCDPLYVNGFE